MRPAVEARVRAGATARTATSTPTALELFAGAGGLALGLHRAGFELVDLIDNDAACCETLRANADAFGIKAPREIEPRDVRELDFREFRGATILSAGAPCQPFSRAGNRRGHYDGRNMFPEVIRAVAEARPRAFLIENVRGLTFEAERRYLNSVLARLRNPSADGPTDDLDDLYGLRAPAAGPGDEYRVETGVLNAADFGLSQNRPRLFIVGLHRDEPAWTWPEPTNSRGALIEALRGETYWNDHPGLNEDVKTRARERLPKARQKHHGARWRTLRDVTSVLGPPSPTGEEAEDQAHVFIAGARLYGTKHSGSRHDWPAKTVKAGVHGTPGGEHILLTDDGGHRYFTLRECAVLQGFPEDYELPALRTPAMKQLGNAVPVAVAEAIGRHLIDLLNDG